MRPLTLVQVVSCCVALAPFAASRAQGTGTLAGIVHDQSGTPLGGVRFTSDPGGVVAISDSVGHFMLKGLAAARTHFQVRRIGYEGGEFVAEIIRDSTLQYELTLVAVPVELPGIESRAASNDPAWMHSFNDHRISQGGGHFFTREDIERANPRQLSDVLRSIPGMHFLADPNGQHTAQFARSSLGAFGNCPIQYWVDGMRQDNFDIDGITPSDVAAMEVYAGPATLPPEYRTRLGTPGCGTIVIWLRKQ